MIGNMGHEFDLMVKTMDLIDKVLAENPKARMIVEEARRREEQQEKDAYPKEYPYK